VRDREVLARQLTETGLLEVYPSWANFLLCRVLRGSAPRWNQELRRRGIFLRYFETPRLEDHLRVSVGRPQDHKALLAALKEIEGTWLAQAG
jgi:histidinol-phosphate aminotransferase